MMFGKTVVVVYCCETPTICGERGHVASALRDNTQRQQQLCNNYAGLVASTSLSVSHAGFALMLISSLDLYCDFDSS